MSDDKADFRLSDGTRDYLLVMNTVLIAYIVSDAMGNFTLLADALFVIIGILGLIDGLKLAAPGQFRRVWGVIR